jgi:hypothetical protein
MSRDVQEPNPVLRTPEFVRAIDGSFERSLDLHRTHLLDPRMPTELCGETCRWVPDLWVTRHPAARSPPTTVEVEGFGGSRVGAVEPNIIAACFLLPACSILSRRPCLADGEDLR